ISWFQHLYDILLGHSIIPDIVNGVIRWFRTLLGMGPALIGQVVQRIITVAGGLVALVKHWASIGLQMVAQLIGTIAARLKTIATDLATFFRPMFDFITNLGTT